MSDPRQLLKESWQRLSEEDKEALEGMALELWRDALEMMA